MEAVGSINHLCPLISGRTGSQPSDNTAHGCVTVNDIVMLLIEKFLQLLIGFQIPFFQWTPLKGHHIVMVTKGDDAFAGDLIIVIGRHIHLPALVMEPLDKGLVKHIDVQPDNRCNK